MALLLVALLFTFTLHWHVIQSDRPDQKRGWSKASALVSLALWLSVGLAGRAVGFIGDKSDASRSLAARVVREVSLFTQFVNIYFEVVEDVRFTEYVGELVDSRQSPLPLMRLV